MNTAAHNPFCLRSVTVFILHLLFSACAGLPHQAADIPRYDYQIINTYPHQRDAFTQGLLFLDGYLFESTGRYGQSSLRKVDLVSGRVLQQYDLSDDFFAEGLTVWKDWLMQVTLTSETGFAYDRRTFEICREFSYTGSAWGLTNDGVHVVMSDGTSTLRYFDPMTFEETGQLKVTENGDPVNNINELQMVRDEIFANILFSDEIIMIDPSSGHVTGRVNLEGLLTPEEKDTANVLNGIAYDSDGDRLFVTGKLWPKLFEIELIVN